jgi:hypothetical protein
LALLARHGVNRAEIGHDGSPAPAAQAMFADLFESCRGWASVRPRGPYAAGQENPASRHLWVLGHLQVSALRRLQPGHARQFVVELTRLGVPQLYQAWRAARKAG